MILLILISHFCQTWAHLT